MSNGRSFRRSVARNSGVPAVPRSSGSLIVYGARCTWFGPKSMVAAKPSGLPCCPHCGGVLFEIDGATWWQGAERAEREGRERYVEFLHWLQGREAPCRPMREFDALYREFLALGDAA